MTNITSNMADRTPWKIDTRRAVGRPPLIMRLCTVAFSISLLVASSCTKGSKTLEEKRDKMVRLQLEQRGVKDPAVLNAFKTVPREQFVLPQYRDKSYDDIEAPIALGETLDRPYENAMMLIALAIGPDDKALEIGTGTGYLSALMSRIAKEIYTIEIEPDYANEARKNFKELGYDNIHVKTGDGFLGWPEHAPFNAIIMVCSPPRIPAPLIEQLAEKGRLLLPLGGSEKFQELILYTKKNGKLVELQRLAPATFAPMKGIIKEGK